MDEQANIIAKQAFQDYDDLDAMAEYIRDEFEKKEGGKWFCIVGMNYGCENHIKAFSYSISLGVYDITLIPFPS